MQAPSHQAQLTTAAPPTGSSVPGTATPPPHDPTQVAATHQHPHAADKTVTTHHPSQALLPPPSPPPAGKAALPGQSSTHRSHRGAALIAAASILAIGGVIAVSLAVGAKKPQPAPTVTVTAQALPAPTATVNAKPAVSSESNPTQSHVVIKFSGNGDRNSQPFLVNGPMLTASYHYNCSELGGTGAFDADMVSGTPGSLSYDDQAIAGASGSGGSENTTLYPQNQGSDYHLVISSDCLWSVTITSG